MVACAFVCVVLVVVLCVIIGLVTGNMSVLRLILVCLGLPLGCALVGLCAGYAIGVEVGSAWVASAPKGVRHGPAYVAAGLCILVSLGGMLVGAVSGGVLAIWCLRGRWLRQRRHPEPLPTTR